MASKSAVRETPDVAGKRLQAQLDAICPSLQVCVYVCVSVLGVMSFFVSIVILNLQGRR